MVKKKLWLIILPCLAFNATDLCAQLDTLWTRSFGEDGWDFGESVQQTTDGGYIVAGVAGADINHQADVYLVKTSETGDTQWTRTIGRSQTAGTDNGNCVRQTTDGGYIITGHSSLPGEDTLWEIYLIKTDSSGDTVWTRTFGGSLSEHGVSVQQTIDEGYIITGWTYSYGAGGLDVFLLKTDALGHSVWMRTFGGPFDEGGASVQQVSDGGYLIGGYTRSSSGGGYADVYLIKTDSTGVAEWERTYGGDLEDLGYSALQATSGGYIIAGSTRSFGVGASDVYLIRTDEVGDTLWTRTFGGYDDDTGFSLIETEEGDYVIVGKTMSFGTGNDDVYLVKIDESGNVLWTWVFGGSIDEAGRSVQETSDGGYVIAGNIGSYAGEYWDFYLIKTSPEIVAIGEGESPLISLPKSYTLHQNYPNPFNPLTTISFELPEDWRSDGKVNLIVYDIRGKLVRTLVDSVMLPGVYRIHWDGRNHTGESVSSGIYLYTLKSGDKIYTKKMVMAK
jgi:hypothetical protein